MRLISKLLALFAFTALSVGAFFIPASANETEETLTVGAVWVDGDMLRVNVTDAEGTNSALALRLTDYIKNPESDEYISIQAVDLQGNKSGLIEIKNPFYIPNDKTISSGGNVNTSSDTPETPFPEEAFSFLQSFMSSENLPSDESKSNAFTPDGSGEIIDNVTNNNSKEFFTINTEDGGVFYLIVDRERNTDNVYFLNAVTEQDLIALAEKNGKTLEGTVSAIPEVEEKIETNSAGKPIDDEEKTPEKNKNGTYIFLGIAVLAAGGVAYYLKIVKDRKNSTDYDDTPDDYDYEDETEEYLDGGDEE